MKTRLIIGGTAAVTAAGIWVGCVGEADEKAVPTASEPVVESREEPLEEAEAAPDQQAEASEDETSVDDELEPTPEVAERPTPAPSEADRAPVDGREKAEAAESANAAKPGGGDGFQKWRMYAKTAEASLTVEPMNCPGCKEAIRAKFEATPGIERVEFRDGEVVVTFNVQTIGPEDLAPRLRKSDHAEFEAEMAHAAPLEMLPKDERRPPEDFEDGPPPAEKGGDHSGSPADFGQSETPSDSSPESKGQERED